MLCVLIMRTQSALLGLNSEFVNIIYGLHHAVYDCRAHKCTYLNAQMCID